MRHLPYVLLTLAVLVGCGPQTAKNFDRAAAPPPDTYTHQPTGTRFPVQVGPFARAYVLDYHGLGENAAVGYLLRDGGRTLSLTVYLYPVPDTYETDKEARTTDDEDYLHDRFEAAKADLERALPGIRLVSEESVALTQRGRGYPVAKAVYALNGPANGWSLIYLLINPDDWCVKYRATAVGYELSDVEAKVQQFMQSLNASGI